MFDVNALIKHNFFGYGIILESNEKTSDVYFADGKRTIMNTHLTQIVNKIEYEKIYSLYVENLNKEKEEKRLEEEKIRLKHEAEKEKQRRKEEREKNKLQREQEKIEKEKLKKRKKEEVELIQKAEYEKYKSFSIYNENLDKLNEFMYEDIYLLEKFKFYLRKNNIPLDDEIVEYALYYLGYRMRTKEIILNNRWSSIEEYFENEACKYDRYFYNNKFNLEIYDDIIKRLERKMVLFEASPGVYITKRLMTRLGINQSTLRYFQNSIIRIGNTFSFFTAKHVCEEMPNNKIIEFASETKQIEKFILSVPNIKSIQSDDDKYIFSFSEERFTRPLFLEMLFNNIESIDIYDLKAKIEKEYDVIFNIDSLIYCVNNSSLYYSEEMEKIYKNKKVFLKEIFNE